MDEAILNGLFKRNGVAILQPGRYQMQNTQIGSRFPLKAKSIPASGSLLIQLHLPWLYRATQQMQEPIQLFSHSFYKCHRAILHAEMHSKP